MTREEAIEELERLLSHWDDLEKGKRRFRWYSKAALDVALSALRPVTREQVEKVWRGEWKITYDEGKEKTIVVCSRCGEETVYDFMLESDELVDFCPVCGAPMTAEAVELVLKRLEALYEG